MVISWTFCFSQDVITKKSGEDINAKVLEVTSTEIKYKKFDNQTGPTISILKSDVFMIKYENGTKDVFKDETPSNNITTNNSSSDKDKKEKSELKGPNKIQLSVGIFNPIKNISISNYLYNTYLGGLQKTPPIIFSYERNLSKLFSLGGMFIYTSAKGNYDYISMDGYYDSYGIWHVPIYTTEVIKSSVLFLGVVGNFHIYTSNILDFTAGAALGYAGISETSETYVSSSSVFSDRFNAALAIYLSPNFGLFARAGTWGKTLAFDLGATFKF